MTTHQPTLSGFTRRLSGTALAVLATLLVACSHEHPAPAAANAAPSAVAVARGQVVIEGGLLKLGTSRDGTLTGVAVHEGDHVRKGQLMATLDVKPAQLAVQGAQAALQQARAQQQLLDDKLKTARRQDRRLAAAAKAGAGDGQSADVAHAAVTDLLAERQAAAAAVAMATQKLDSARYELSLRQIKAPVNAEVVSVSAQTGATVQPGTAPLFTLLPQTPRIVRAELNDSFANAVHPGMAAHVSLDSDPDGAALPAHVVRLGNTVGAATLAEDPLQRANERTVVCVLSFDSPQTLRIGQRVLVRFGDGASPASSGRERKAR